MVFESILPSVGGGALIGFIAGYAVKKLAKVGMIIAGLLAALLGYLELNGLIQVNWNGLSSFVGGFFGTGVDASSFLLDAFNGLLGLFPAAGGFAVGAAIGFKKG